MKALLITLTFVLGCSMQRSRITREPFGQLPDGRHVELFTLRNDHGIELRAISAQEADDLRHVRLRLRVGRHAAACRNRARPGVVRGERERHRREAR